MKYKSEINDFLTSNGFKLVEHHTSNFFDDYCDIYSNYIFQLRINRSKSKETIDVRSIEEDENWYDLALVKALLNKEENLNVVISFNEYSEFIKNELDSIMKFFNKRNYQTTKKKLDELGNKRVKQMFPGI